ncbi:MAG: HAMP domain-containing sensor histidine kinase [Dehalococcoidales bacterium]|nr:HAMP domain-containing sensor histidine kinase [Dehalococcoidales bacterium]
MTDDSKIADVYELAHRLDERVKELNCLYGISRLAEDRQLSIDDFLQRVVDIIPQSWQHTQSTCARIQLTDKEVSTSNFLQTRWCQFETITVNGKYFGKIEVCYTAEMPVSDEGPFLKEERHLIRAVAERLGHIIERNLADAELKKWYEEEKRLRQRLEQEIQWRVNFTRNLIHELKTPLTSLVATSQLLYEEEAESKLGRLARYVWEGANNLNNRIDELHDIVRGEMGSISFNPKPCYIGQLLDDIITETKPLAEQYDMEVEIKLPLQLPQVYADPVRIRQVLLNLLNNSFKYATEGKRVIIKASVRNSYVSIEVRDFGPGIGDLEQAQLFDPGYQDVRHSKRSGGLGIGLSLCKILVELHGGKIWISDKAGKGTSVIFTLPLLSGKSVEGQKENGEAV